MKKPSASVTASGVIAIAGSVLVLLGGAMGLMGVRLAPMNRVNPPLPPLARAMAEVTVAFIVELGVFGVLSGIGLLRLKNWARISTLVWSGVTVVICTLVLVVFAVAPFPPSPNTPPNFAGIMRAALLIFYGLPLAIGIWWLILFNRQSIANQFVPAAGDARDASGFPSEALVPSRSALPLPIAIFAVFLLTSSLSVFIPLVLPVPVILFGHALRGLAGTAIWVGFCIATLAAGIGLLRLKRWSYDLALGLQLFWLVSGIVYYRSRFLAASASRTKPA